MKSINYHDKSNNVYTVKAHVQKESTEDRASVTNGYMTYVKNTKSKKGWRELEDSKLPFTSDLQQAKTDLMNYAKEHMFRCECAVNIDKDPKRILQGKTIQSTDFKALTPTELWNRTEKFLQADQEINRLEADKKLKIDRMKLEYNEKIEEKQKVIDAIKPVLNRRAEEIKVASSWERNPESEEMVLLRHKDMIVMKFRDMTADEKEPNVFDKKSSYNELLKPKESKTVKEGKIVDINGKPVEHAK